MRHTGRMGLSVMVSAHTRDELDAAVAEMRDRLGLEVTMPAVRVPWRRGRMWGGDWCARLGSMGAAGSRPASSSE